MQSERRDPAPRVSAQAAPRTGLSVVTRSKLFFFGAAGLSFLGSVTLWFGGSREEGLFVGLWVPSILAAGALLLAGEGEGDRDA